MMHLKNIPFSLSLSKSISEICVNPFFTRPCPIKDYFLVLEIGKALSVKNPTRKGAMPHFLNSFNSKGNGEGRTLNFAKN